MHNAGNQYSTAQHCFWNSAVSIKLPEACHTVATLHLVLLDAAAVHITLGTLVLVLVLLLENCCCSSATADRCSVGGAAVACCTSYMRGVGL